MKVLALFDASYLSDAYECLEPLKFDFDLVQTWKEALSYLQSRHYDLILCQSNLQGHEEGALGCLRALRHSRKIEKSIPFICCQIDPEIQPSQIFHLRAAIETMGGQGLISEEQFSSNHLAHHIGSCLGLITRV